MAEVVTLGVAQVAKMGKFHVGVKRGCKWIYGSRGVSNRHRGDKGHAV